MNIKQNQADNSIPTVCVICGKHDELKLMTYKATHVPPISYLLVLFGIVFGAIIIALIKRKYTFQVFYCSKCLGRNNYKKKLIHYTTMLSSISCLLLGPIIGIMYQSWLIGLGGIAISITIAILAGEYENITKPKIIKYDKNSLTIDIPSYGKWDIYFPNI
jgi:hypothetical protein